MENPTPNTPEKKGGLPSIRTYQSDVEALMQKERVSKSDIAISENERVVKRSIEKLKVAAEKAPRRAEPAKVFHISGAIPLSTRRNWRPVIFASLGIVVVAGAVAGGLLIWKNRTIPEPLEPPAQVAKTHATTLDGGERRAGVISAVRAGIEATTPPSGELAVIPLERSGATVSTAEFLSLLETKASQSLVRALGANMVLGVHSSQESEPFLLFPVTSFEYAFAGMLAWETTILDDIGPVFEVALRAGTQIDTTTKDTLDRALTLKDTVIRNKDVRAVFAQDGRIVFLYAFIDKKTLVLTTNDATFQLLIGKAAEGRLR